VDSVLLLLSSPLSISRLCPVASIAPIKHLHFFCWYNPTDLPWWRLGQATASVSWVVLLHFQAPWPLPQPGPQGSLSQAQQVCSCVLFAASLEPSTLPVD
jgi:hypothetical protein